jgi:hypothetical protein
LPAVEAVEPTTEVELVQVVTDRLFQENHLEAERQLNLL